MVMDERPQTADQREFAARINVEGMDQVPILYSNHVYSSVDILNQVATVNFAQYSLPDLRGENAPGEGEVIEIEAAPVVRIAIPLPKFAEWLDSITRNAEGWKPFVSRPQIATPE
jgi:hypothetical protein